MNWTTFYLMQFCWALSDKHWIFKPFSWLGDRLEDFGLKHNLIEIADDIQQEINEAKINL